MVTAASVKAGYKGGTLLVTLMLVTLTDLLSVQVQLWREFWPPSRPKSFWRRSAICNSAQPYTIHHIINSAHIVMKLANNIIMFLTVHMIPSWSGFPTGTFNLCTFSRRLHYWQCTIQWWRNFDQCLWLNGRIEIYEFFDCVRYMTFLTRLAILYSAQCKWLQEMNCNIGSEMFVFLFFWEFSWAFDFLKKICHNSNLLI